MASIDKTLKRHRTYGDIKSLKSEIEKVKEAISKAEKSDSESDVESIDLTVPSPVHSDTEDEYEVDDLDFIDDSAESAVYVCFNDCTFNL